MDCDAFVCGFMLQKCLSESLIHITQSSVCDFRLHMIVSACENKLLCVTDGE